MARDCVDDLLDILSTNWSNTNTDSITPSFLRIIERKEVVASGNNDFILVYDTTTEENIVGLGYPSFGSEFSLAIDIRSGYGSTVEEGISHLKKLREEVRRILHLARKNPCQLKTTPETYYDYVYYLRATDLCDKMRRLYREVIDCKFVKLVENI